MNKGTIYLIQPCELIGTSRFKIGCSKNPDLERCKNGYKKGTRYICIMECNNPFLLENKIKEIFNSKFKLIAGNEYYEGNENDIYKLFIEIINEHKNNIENININKLKLNTELTESESANHDSDSDSDSEMKEDYLFMTQYFKNYKEDEIFEGNKQLIKIHIYYDEIKISYIYDNIIEEERVSNENNSDFHNNYLKKLVKNKIIEDNKIYDLNNINFIKKIKTCMKKIDIYNSNNINKINEFFINKCINNTLSKIEKIDMYFKNNLIINTNILSYTYITDFCNFPCDIKLDIYKNKEINIIKEKLKIIKINKQYYDYQFLRENIPYQLHIGQKYFFIENRDYQTFNLQRGNIIDTYESIYLFNDNCPPWSSGNNNSNLKNIINKYNKLTSDKICLNLSEDTKYLLKIFE